MSNRLTAKPSASSPSPGDVIFLDGATGVRALDAGYPAAATAAAVAGLPKDTPHSYTRKVGLDYVSGGNSASGNLFLLSMIRLTAGRVSNIKVHFTTVGATITLVLVRPLGSGQYQVVETKQITLGGSSPQTLVGGSDFPAWILDGQLQIGIQSETSGLKYDSTTGPGYSYTPGVVSGVFTEAGLTMPGSIFYSVTISVSEYRKGGATIESTDFGCLPYGWSNTDWTFDPSTKSATSASAGVTNPLNSGLYTALDSRTLRWEFSLGSLDSIAGFLTYPTEAMAQGSLVRVNAATQAIEICWDGTHGYTGGAGMTVLATTPATIASNTKYYLDWVKNGRSFTATLKQRDGTVIASITRSPATLGYVSYPSGFYYDQGAMEGCAGIAKIAGTITVYSFDHRAGCSIRPQLYVIGDSITQGFSITDAQNYVSVLRAQLGSDNVIASAVGGAVSAGCLVRMKAEISQLAPKNVLIFIGNNSDASLAANLGKLTTMALVAGANVYVATPPASAAYTTIVNALIGWVRKVKFDLALTASGGGSAVVASLYENTDAGGAAYNDSIHPNALGHVAMVARLRLDAPEIFEV